MELGSYEVLWLISFSDNTKRIMTLKNNEKRDSAWNKVKKRQSLFARRL
jgi:hypothetical protein